MQFFSRIQYKKMFPPVCRVCLSGHIKMDPMETTGLQEMYEKFSDNKLQTEDGRPTTICYMCRSLLLKCHQFYETSQKAEKLLTDLVNNAWQLSKKLNIIFNQGLSHHLSISTTLVSFNDTDLKSSDKCKYEVSPKEEFDEFQYIDDLESVSIEFTKSIANTIHDDVSKSSEVIESNKEKENKEKVYTCDTCSETFSQKSHMEKHIKIVHNMQYACKRCHCTFTTSSDLKEHNSKIHSKEANSTKKTYPIKHKPHECKICNKTLCSELRFKKHMKLHSKPKPRCIECDRNFPSNSALKEHNIRIHSGLKPFACSQCDKKYSNKRYLQLHMEIHSGKTHLCDTCGKGFSKRKVLRNHIMTHNAVKSIICNICSKAFRTVSHLKSHMITHSDLKPYSCSQCGKSFASNGLLRVHMRTHTAEKPFVCEPCNRAFSQKYNLYRHNISVHSGVKPHVCDSCQMAFPTKSILRIHMRTHTGEKPYVCDVCNQAFSVKHTLKGHIQRMHSGLKPFACGVCDVTFSTKSGRDRHVRKSHEAKPCLQSE